MKCRERLRLSSIVASLLVASAAGAGTADLCRSRVADEDVKDCVEKQNAASWEMFLWAVEHKVAGVLDSMKDPSEARRKMTEAAEAGHIASAVYRKCGEAWHKKEYDTVDFVGVLGCLKISEAEYKEKGVDLDSYAETTEQE